LPVGGRSVSSWSETNKKADPMKLYSGPLSLFSRKVEMALHEKGLPFEVEYVAFSQDEGYRPKHPAVLATNPKGQVPVLADGGLKLFDSTVILEYLEDAYPTPPLYPKAPAARARCRQLELYADEILLQPVVRLLYRTESAHPDPKVREQRKQDAQKAEAALQDHYGRVEGFLADQDYFCGAFSAADIGIFATLHHGLRLNAPRLDAHPSLAAWHKRVGARPAFARVVAEMAEADRNLSHPLQP
jgi:glutathione S-transferase